MERRTSSAPGATRIGAIADIIRQEVGEALVHVDSGDAIHGTGAAQWTNGAAVIPALRAAIRRSATVEHVSERRTPDETSIPYVRPVRDP